MVCIASTADGLTRVSASARTRGLTATDWCISIRMLSMCSRKDAQFQNTMELVGARYTLSSVKIVLGAVAIGAAAVDRDKEDSS